MERDEHHDEGCDAHDDLRSHAEGKQQNQTHDEAEDRQSQGGTGWMQRGDS